jgi:hypothetical protein
MNPIKLRVRGATIATAATSAVAAIPDKSAGGSPSRVRLACTLACYARLGLPSEASAAVQAAGTGYTPGDTITLTGGTFAEAMRLTVATTKVVSATVAAAGTGGTPGSATVTGTTGTGTKFEATVTIGAGGTMESVDSISTAGSYTVNPTAIATEPVTGGGLTGAQLAVVMGVATATVTRPGVYTALPSNAVAQGATSGSGVNATFNVTWATAAAAGDLLITPDAPVIVDASSCRVVAAIRVAADGVLQIQPLED